MPDTIYFIGRPPEHYFEWLSGDRKRRLIIIGERGSFDSPQVEYALQEDLWYQARWAVAHTYAILGEDNGLASLLRQHILARRVVHDEYLGMGLFYFCNFYRNLRNSHLYREVNSLYNALKDVPAIICGAGPSLNKHLLLLNTYRQQACIFACGGALGALAFRPHFGVAIDPLQGSTDRLYAHNFFELPILANLRLHWQALELCHGPTFLVNSSGGYNTASCLDSSLGWPAEERDEGYSSVTFATGLAHFFGCNPIIFVGLDLAFSEKKDACISNCDTHWEAPFQTTDIYGKEITSLWKWWAESRWLAHFVQEHPETQFINATDGGIGIPGVPNQSIGIYKNRDVDQQIHAHVQASRRLPHSHAFLSSLRQSFKTADGYLDKMMDALGENIALPDGELANAFILKDTHMVLQEYLSQKHRDADVNDLEAMSRKARLYVALREVIYTHLELMACT